MATSSRGRFAALLLHLLMLTGCNLMPPVGSEIPGYVTGDDGELLFDEEGRCWRTANWQPSYAIPQCDPELYEAMRRPRVARAGDEEPPEPEEEPVQPDEALAERGDEKDTTKVEEGEEVAGIDGVAEVAEEDPEQDEQPAEGRAAEGTAVAPVATVEAVETDEAEVPGEEREEEAVTERALHFSDEVHFHFGHYRLTPEAEETIERMMRRLRMHGAQDLSVRIVGHSDRVGDSEANQRLSRERARAVRDMLVERGIDAGVITVEGRGATESVTTSKQCPADIHECELILCLRPDRRAEITVEAVRRLGAN